MSALFGFGDTGRRLLDYDNKLKEALESLRAYLTSEGRPGLLTRYQSSQPNSIWNRGIMWTCMGTCSAVWLLWQFSTKSVRLPLIPARYQTIRTKARLREWLVVNFTCKTEDVRLGRWWTMITASFSHIELAHLVSNSSMFLSFSKYLISMGISPERYTALILGSAMTGSFAATYHQAVMEKRQGIKRIGFGLSAVCMGLITASTAVSPTAEVSVMTLGRVPLWMAAIAYVLFDTYMIDSPTSKLGHGAHIGGAVFGAAYSYMTLRGRLPVAALLRL